MNFKEFLYLEEPVISTRAAGRIDPLIGDPETGKSYRFADRERYLNLILNSEVSKGTEEQDIWGSFSCAERFGLKYDARDGGTPLGLYGYPVKYILDKNFNVPYASSREYLHVFKIINKESFIKFKQNDEIINAPKAILKSIRSHLDTVYNRKYIKFSKLFNKKINDSIKEFIELVHDFIPEESHYDFEAGIRHLFDDFKFVINRRYQDFINYNSIFASEDQKVEKIKKYLSDLENDLMYLNEDFVFKIIKFIVSKIDSSNQNIDYEQFSTLPGIKEFKDKFEKLIITIKNKIIKEVKNYKKVREDQFKKIQFRGKEQLENFCKQNSIDWEDVLSEVLYYSNSNSGKFIYNLTEKIAGRLNSKKHRKWTILLRKMGIEGLLDDENTGSIYSSEPTQGAFFNLKNLELIKTIKVNNSDECLNSKYYPYNSPEQKKKEKLANHETRKRKLSSSIKNFKQRFYKGLQLAFNSKIHLIEDNYRTLKIFDEDFRTNEKNPGVHSKLEYFNGFAVELKKNLKRYAIYINSVLRQYLKDIQDNPHPIIVFFDGNFLNSYENTLMQITSRLFSIHTYFKNSSADTVYNSPLFVSNKNEIIKITIQLEKISDGLVECTRNLYLLLANPTNENKKQTALVAQNSLRKVKTIIRQLDIK